MAQNIKQAIHQLKTFHASEVPMIDVIRCWMIITGLDFKDAIHLSYEGIRQGLDRVQTKLEDSIDLFDEDQLQEAACRCLKNIKIFGEGISDGDFAVEHGQDIEWDGSKWLFIVDPKLRMRETTTQFKVARDAVQAMLKSADDS